MFPHYMKINMDEFPQLSIFLYRTMSEPSKNNALKITMAVSNEGSSLESDGIITRPIYQ